MDTNKAEKVKLSFISIIKHSPRYLAIFLCFLTFVMLAQWLMIYIPRWIYPYGLTESEFPEFLDIFEKSFGIAASLTVAMVAVVLAQSSLSVSEQQTKLSEKQTKLGQMATQATVTQARLELLDIYQRTSGEIKERFTRSPAIELYESLNNAVTALQAIKKIGWAEQDKMKHRYDSPSEIESLDAELASLTNVNEELRKLKVEAVRIKQLVLDWPHKQELREISSRITHSLITDLIQLGRHLPYPPADGEDFPYGYWEPEEFFRQIHPLLSGEVSQDVKHQISLAYLESCVPSFNYHARIGCSTLSENDLRLNIKHAEFSHIEADSPPDDPRFDDTEDYFPEPEEDLREYVGFDNRTVWEKTKDDVHTRAWPHIYRDLNDFILRDGDLSSLIEEFKDSLVCSWSKYGPDDLDSESVKFFYHADKAFFLIALELCASEAFDKIAGREMDRIESIIKATSKDEEAVQEFMGQLAGINLDAKKRLELQGYGDLINATNKLPVILEGLTTPNYSAVVNIASGDYRMPAKSIFGTFKGINTSAEEL